MKSSFIIRDTIADIIAEINSHPKDRELAIVCTKLEEAGMWLQAHINEQGIVGGAKR